MDKKNLTEIHNSRVYDNFLIHWKYTKREKINGKWRYWYDDATESEAQTDGVSDELSEEEKFAENIRKQRENLISEVERDKALIDELESESRELNKKLDEAEDMCNEKQRKYDAVNNIYKDFPSSRYYERQVKKAEAEITKADKEWQSIYEKTVKNKTATESAIARYAVNEYRLKNFDSEWKTGSNKTTIDKITNASKSAKKWLEDLHKQ